MSEPTISNQSFCVGPTHSHMVFRSKSNEEELVLEGGRRAGKLFVNPPRATPRDPNRSSSILRKRRESEREGKDVSPESAADLSVSYLGWFLCAEKPQAPAGAQR
ncbi:hypothetical protein BHE74_00037619 [Ensete ventricosum]|nr:hypothetical protein GW17_00059982 [Ensete ventricosum]RWW55716.1 hypothetical protein BHE74_00037619 [Ensete ventricosum]RZS11375.1 hypothetical protein BHM03_00042713 [Ensete ventricosum]